MSRLQYAPCFGTCPCSEVPGQECLARGGAGALRGAHRVRPILSRTHHSQASRIMHDFGSSEERRTERARWPMEDGSWYSHRLRMYESWCRAAQSPQAGMTMMIRRRGDLSTLAARRLRLGQDPPPPVEDRWPLAEIDLQHPPDGRMGAGGSPTRSLRASWNGRRTSQEKSLESS